jgi:hypothetical protein
MSLGVLITLGATNSGAFAASLHDPVTHIVEGAQEQRTAAGPDLPVLAAREAAQIAPVEDWRIRAVEALRLPDSPETAQADFNLLLEGIHAKPAGRNLAQEFVAELSDSRIKGAFEAARQDKGNAIVGAQARLAVADAVLDRKGLDTDHAAAAHERACMLFVLSAPQKEILAAFEQTANRKSDPSEAVSKSRAALAALRNPETTEDYTAAVELLDLSTQYWSRKAGGWVAGVTLRQLKQKGVSHVSAAKFAGDTAPLRAAARVAFELDQPKMLEEILQDAERSTLAPADLVEIRYWTAMCSYANRDYQNGIALFQENLFSGVLSKYVAESGLEAAQSAILSYDFAMAGVYLFEVMEGYKQFPEQIAKAERSFDFLIESGKLDDVKFQTSLAKFRNDYKLAMAPANTIK